MKRIIKQLSNVQFQVNNILELYKLAEPEEIISGRQWYKQANELANVMAVKYNITLFQSAGIISALSPGIGWSQNIVDANNLCSLLNSGKDIHSVTVTTYGNNKDKAYTIYSSPELSEEAIYKLLLGASKQVNKTSSFYVNLLHPDKDEIVTIDRHAYRINLGIEELPDIALTEKRYRTMVQAYKIASNEIEYSAIELQAITWLIFRRLYITVKEAKFEDVPF